MSYYAVLVVVQAPDEIRAYDLVAQAIPDAETDSLTLYHEAHLVSDAWPVKPVSHGKMIDFDACDVMRQGAEGVIMATIIPQAWINDYAVTVDPGPVKFDITEQVVAMSREDALAIEDHTYESDEFWNATPDDERPFLHHGPFEVECEEAIRNYYRGRRGAE